MQVQACNSRFEECCSRLLLALSVAVIAEPQQWESALVGILAGPFGLAWERYGQGFATLNPKPQVGPLIYGLAA